MLPLSKEEREYIAKLKKLSMDGKCISLTDYEKQEMQDVLMLLCQEEVLVDVSADNTNWYAIIGDFEAFEKRLAIQEKKIKRLSKREAKVAIISAAVGAVVGAIATSVITSWASITSKIMEFLQQIL